MLKLIPNRKSVFCLILSAVMLLCLLSGCGAEKPPVPEPEAEVKAEATPAPTAAPAVSAYEGSVIISELMYRNSSSFPGEARDFPDYIEIKNISDAPVPLDSWGLSDRAGEVKWSFPSCSIAPGELLLICCSEQDYSGLHCDFSLSEGEELFLTDPEGFVISSALCKDQPDGCSLGFDEEGQMTVQTWISPGYENGPRGYDAFAASLEAMGPLVINEVVVSPSAGLEEYDWVELKNISSETVALASYYLSDDEELPDKWQFPDVSLSPGEYLLVSCSDGEEPSAYGRSFTNFSLDSEFEKLFLSGPEGLEDFVCLHDIPAGGSMGRLSGENGFFYITEPSPGTGNNEGLRRISAAPVFLTEDGIFEDQGPVSVEISASADIYYTTDGSLPNSDSQLYTEPISVESTSVLRAVAIEEGALPSPAATQSFIIDEHFTLPVLSLVTDSPYNFYNMYTDGRKGVELQGNLALYGDPAAFNHRCSVEMKGFTSLNLPKKSMGVSFKGCHGGKLEADLFQNGVDSFSKLSIRAGQDYTFAFFRNELFQELCLEASDSLLTQSGKYCILYVNGEYYGIYCLKEDLNSQFYASHAGVSKSSVECIKFPAPMGCSFWNEVLEFCWNNDMSQSENYEYICSVVDIDSLIDWIIFEGYSANTDTQGNLKIFRSPENGNKWQFSFYDLDWAFSDGRDFELLLEDKANTGYLMPSLIQELFHNPDFEQAFLLRFKELNETTLSNQHVLEKIDRLQALLDPEIPRERQRWNLDYDQWLVRVDELRAYINDCDREIRNIDSICRILGIDEARRQEIFGR